MANAGTTARLLIASQSQNPYGGSVIDVGNGSVIVQNTVPPYVSCGVRNQFAAYGRLLQINTCLPNSFWASDKEKAAPPQYVVGRRGLYSDAYGNAYTN